MLSRVIFTVVYVLIGMLAGHVIVQSATWVHPITAASSAVVDALRGR